jgi:hypothetical protein
MAHDKPARNGASAGGGATGRGGGDLADRRRAWCEILRLVREEADAANQPFLVYLVDIAIEHAVSIEREGRLREAERP